MKQKINQIETELNLYFIALKSVKQPGRIAAWLRDHDGEVTYWGSTQREARKWVFPDDPVKLAKKIPNSIVMQYREIERVFHDPANQANNQD